MRRAARPRVREAAPAGFPHGAHLKVNAPEELVGLNLLHAAVSWQNVGMCESAARREEEKKKASRVAVPRAPRRDAALRLKSLRSSDCASALRN